MTFIKCSRMNFGRSTTFGNVCYCAKFFFHLEIMALTVVLWSPKAFEIACNPSHMDVLYFNHLVLYNFRNFFHLLLCFISFFQAYCITAF